MWSNHCNTVALYIRTQSQKLQELDQFYFHKQATLYEDLLCANCSKRLNFIGSGTCVPLSFEVIFVHNEGRRSKDKIVVSQEFLEQFHSSLDYL